VAILLFSPDPGIFFVVRDFCITSATDVNPSRRLSFTKCQFKVLEELPAVPLRAFRRIASHNIKKSLPDVYARREPPFSTRSFSPGFPPI